MVEALWTANFISGELNEGGRVVILETEKIYGGDSQFYYLGSYKINDGKISAKIKVTRYYGQGNSIFGQRESFEIEVNGDTNSNKMILSGNLLNKPNNIISIGLIKREDLP